MKAETAARQAAALELRLTGATFEQIARLLNLSGRGAVHKIVHRALKARVAAGVDELRALELDRLDALLRAVWPAAMEGSPRHVDAALRISVRRSELVGLNWQAAAAAHDDPSTLGMFFAAMLPGAAAVQRPDYAELEP